MYYSHCFSNIFLVKNWQYTLLALCWFAYVFIIFRKVLNFLTLKIHNNLLFFTFIVRHNKHQTAWALRFFAILLNIETRRRQKLFQSTTSTPFFTISVYTHRSSPTLSLSLPYSLFFRTYTERRASRPSIFPRSPWLFARYGLTRARAPTVIRSKRDPQSRETRNPPPPPPPPTLLRAIWRSIFISWHGCTIKGNIYFRLFKAYLNKNVSAAATRALCTIVQRYRGGGGGGGGGGGSSSSCAGKKER